MNINELDNFNLQDAVKFHSHLNPRIWGKDEKLKPEVREKLLEIAADFQEFVGVPDLDVIDITVSGSNAAFSYTPHSDIDLHLVIKMPEQNRDVYQELFNAKKYQYNDEHSIKVGGADVELYAQPDDEQAVSQGIYSVRDNEWVQVPKRRKADINDSCVKAKAEDLDARIHSAIEAGDREHMESLWTKIRTMRQAGLDKSGEFGCENLAFKILRNSGCLKQLKLAVNAAKDRELSVAEQVKKPVVYGFRSTVSEEDAGHEGTSSGVSPDTRNFLSEEPDDVEGTVREFIDHTAKYLGIENMPEIHLHNEPEWSKENHSFGMYVPEEHTLHVNLANRHIMDILRTTAHELAHCRQHELDPMPHNAGKTGSPWENEAHAVAGIIMRHFADSHPGLFENASGYIPKNKKEAKDPRYSMAVTVDIKPGQVGKEANKLALNTGKNGEPTLLMKSANLQESLAAEFKLFESGQDLFEVKMTSKNLANLAKDIKGAKVGLEFEMIVPNVANEENSDQEPDYDQDERVRDIDDAVNFFDDGDYNGRNEIRRLREQMESDYFDWQHEKIDEDWHNNGFEFFQEYLDREEPFDPEDYRERAVDEIKAEFPEMPPDSEGFEELVAEKLREINAEYYVETWEAQGRSYDYAQEEFSDEKRDEYSESDWLDDRGIRYASDVQNEYSDIQWPYWSSTGDSEGDIESVALDFMNAMGMDSVAISSSYHGSYKKWVGNGWVSIGSNKPDDCFTIEPDGSLEGDNDSDTGLEFVSPPIPLEDIGTVMKKVQRWAGMYGAYTGDHNKTSIHTNISIPGYDLDKLDYLKAALLLGDEYVLREFDRFGNTYAKPAIEKVKQLIKDKPEKAKELLDKMKSQLNAEASKLIHSGQTNKFTSINTKDNRVEFRSPGGDYLSIIADNPQKMVDTINRMVVTLDAAMDPNKYKEEYQKKLYKALTGDIGSRAGTTGEIEFDITSKANVWNKDTRKQEPAFKTTVKAKTASEAFKKAKDTLPADAKPSEYTITPKPHPTPGDKDLLKYFSRYAAGELPKAALKSFVRQAQLQRKAARDDLKAGKYWWSVKQDGRDNRIEVVAKDELDAKFAAAREWRFAPTDSVLNAMTAEVLRPYEEKPEQPAEQGSGLYKIYDTRGTLIAGDEYGSDRAALARAGVWAMQRGVDVVVKNAQGREVGRVSAFGEITPAAQQPAASTRRWEIVNNATGDVVQVFTGGTEDDAADYALNNYGTRFTFTTRPSDGEIQRVGNQIPNYYIKNRDTDEIVKGYFADDSSAAHEYLTQWKRDNNLADADYVYGRVSALPDAVQRNIVGNRPAQQQGSGEYGIWIQASDRFARVPADQAGGDPTTLRTFPSREAAEEYLTTTRANTVGMRNDIEVREIPQGYELPAPLGRPVSPAFGGQEAPSSDAVSYEIYNRNSGAAIDTFTANSDQEALQKLEDYRNSRRHSFTPEQARLTFGIRRGPGVTNATQPSSVNNLTPRGPGPWEVASRENNQVYYNIGHTNRNAAETEARTWLSQNRHNPDYFEVRTRESVSNTDAAQGGIVDVAGEQPAQAPQTLTRPGQGQQVFTGNWKVMIDGEEVYQFGGIGNSQADANRVGRDWILQQIRQGTLNPANGADVEVLPVMGPAE